MEVAPEKKRRTYALIGAGIALAAAGAAGLYFVSLQQRKHHTRRRRNTHKAGAPDAPPPLIKHRSLTVAREGMTEVFSAQQVQKVWHEFEKHSSDGAIQRDEFRRIFHKLGIHDEKIIESTFKTFDTSGNGQIEFVELCHVLMIISGGTREEKLRVMFSMMDTKKTGVVTAEQLVALYESTFKAGGEKVDNSDLRREIHEVFQIAHNQNPHVPSAFSENRTTISEDEFVRLAHFDVLDLEAGGITQELLREFDVRIEQRDA